MIAYDSPLDLPVSVMLALWAPVPSSYGVAAVQGPDGAHEVADGAARLPLEEWLARVRPLQFSAAVLPAPGEPMPGLAAALEAGEGVLLQAGADAQEPGRAVLLVPQASGTSVLWEVTELPHAPAPWDPSHARRRVHAATEEAIEALIQLDLARERPELADTLNDVITAVLDPRLLPAWLSARQVGLLEKALRLRALCEIAVEDDGAATSAAQVTARLGALTSLHAVAREAVTAATQYLGR